MTVPPHRRQGVHVVAELLGSRRDTMSASAGQLEMALKWIGAAERSGGDEAYRDAAARALQASTRCSGTRCCGRASRGARPGRPSPPRSRASCTCSSVTGSSTCCCAWGTSPRPRPWTSCGRRSNSSPRRQASLCCRRPRNPDHRPETPTTTGEELEARRGWSRSTPLPPDEPLVHGPLRVHRSSTGALVRPSRSVGKRPSSLTRTGRGVRRSPGRGPRDHRCARRQRR